ncbi:FAD-binding oxidoreductase [Streptomyces macrosporus]|uniref:FAD-binding oxidoreductase n=1 Tax=Streptomyces macrosporus TaxID=44032 RepID=A0ABN3JF76_9ACTN
MADDSSAAVRPGASPAPRSGGVRSVVRPESLAEAVDAVRAAAAADRALLFTGAGSALSWGAPPRRTDVVLETTGLNRVLDHAAADLTVRVQAGMSLEELQRLLAPSRQWLPFDPPAASSGATLGGLLACADAGPRQPAFGSLRDLVIGATLVLADGSVVRTGGRVIKNVAGYDLAKLFAGSLGAFGLVAELTLRVHPRPRATATLAVPVAGPEGALTAARAALRSPLEPVAAEWDGAHRLLLRFHGTPGGVEARLRLAAAVPELAGARPIGDEAEQADVWAAQARLVNGDEGDTVLRAGVRPAHLPDLVRSLEECARRDGVEATACGSVAIGVLTVRLRGGDAASHAACLTDWRRTVHALGGTVTLRRRREGVDALADAWGPAPSALPVLRALKRRFDPADRCAPGRFAPWF